MSWTDRLGVTLARLALPAWVGAAVLFVVNGVRLVTSGEFDTPARDHMALIRFPAYYVCGFALVGGALLGVLACRSLRRRGLLIGLLAAALVIMAGDVIWVYGPLAEMITPAGQPRTPRFENLHRSSMWINTVHVGLALAAAVLVTRPRSIRSDDAAPAIGRD